MCLILIAYKHHPLYPLIIAANRDEFYDRPTAPLHFWSEHPGILAGRDLKYGGTWMGITRSGRFAAVTNHRYRGEFREHPLSRGLMVRDYLTAAVSPENYVAKVIARESEYNGFNLLAADGASMVYYSNRSRRLELLEGGIYGLSNRLLNTPWPKLLRSRRSFADLVHSQGEFDPGMFFPLLSDTTRAPDEMLPDTGFGIEWERVLSSPFITSPLYGTRASTVILAAADGEVRVTERSFRHPEDPGITSDITFSIGPAEDGDH